MMGPFTGRLMSRSQYVYHVRVRDSDNRDRCAWLLCTRSIEDKVEVVWEAET